jgi:hypothetical protein
MASRQLIDAGIRGVTGESGDSPAGEASQYAAGGDGSPTANGRMSQPPAGQLQDQNSADTIAGATSRIPWMDQRAVLIDTLTQIGRFEFSDPLERSYQALRAVVKYIDSDLGLALQELTTPLHALINAAHPGQRRKTGLSELPCPDVGVEATGNRLK